ncbi:MAG TPA: hypothetical protein VLV55_12085 [Rhizomicrobium sp.]|nr:hypothetical protein [Rhizomicrobium sp.]
MMVGFIQQAYRFTWLVIAFVGAILLGSLSLPRGLLFVAAIFLPLVAYLVSRLLWRGIALLTGIEMPRDAK